MSQWIQSILRRFARDGSYLDKDCRSQWRRRRCSPAMIRVTPPLAFASKHVPRRGQPRRHAPQMNN